METMRLCYRITIGNGIKLQAKQFASKLARNCKQKNAVQPFKACNDCYKSNIRKFHQEHAILVTTSIFKERKISKIQKLHARIVTTPIFKNRRKKKYQIVNILLVFFYK